LRQALRDRQAQAGFAVAERDAVVGLRDRIEDPCDCSGAMPMPVSSTSNRKVVVRSSAAAPERLVRTSTLPFVVSFSALPTRFCRIWRSRGASPSSRSGMSSATCHVKVSPFAQAWSCGGASVSLSRARNADGAGFGT